MEMSLEKKQNSEKSVKIKSLVIKSLHLKHCIVQSLTNVKTVLANGLFYHYLLNGSTSDRGVFKRLSFRFFTARMS